MGKFFSTFLLVLLFSFLTACASMNGSSHGGNCYDKDTYASRECSTPGYGGFYNPPALDLFRGGWGADNW